jgi:hypothetical protein
MKKNYANLPLVFPVGVTVGYVRQNLFHFFVKHFGQSALSQAFQRYL